MAFRRRNAEPPADFAPREERKQSWPIGEISPWAEADERPTPMQVARWYPARLVGAMGGALIFGIFIAGFVCWGINLLSYAVLGAVPFSSLTSACVAYLVMAPGLVWLDLYGEIRGWWTWGGDA
jgi:hypothetical protein